MFTIAYSHCARGINATKPSIYYVVAPFLSSKYPHSHRFKKLRKKNRVSQWTLSLWLLTLVAMRWIIALGVIDTLAVVVPFCCAGE